MCCRYLKVPPFSNITWLSLSDDGGSLINGGPRPARPARPSAGWGSELRDSSSSSTSMGVGVARPPCGCVLCPSSPTYLLQGRPLAPLHPHWLSAPQPSPAGGSSCIQGAKPGGGGMWTIAATVERIVRVTEQWEYWMNATG
jgi:hypothetical protein